MASGECGRRGFVRDMSANREEQSSLAARAPDYFWIRDDDQSNSCAAVSFPPPSTHSNSLTLYFPQPFPSIRRPSSSSTTTTPFAPLFLLLPVLWVTFVSPSHRHNHHRSRASALGDIRLFFHDFLLNRDTSTTLRETHSSFASQRHHGWFRRPFRDL